MKAIGVFIVIICALSCESLPEYPLAKIETFIYSPGDTLAYKSNKNNIQMLIIDGIDRSYKDNSHTGFPSLKYEHQEVQMHFLHEEDLIIKYDSLLLLWEDCYRINEVASCDTLYDYSWYDRGIELTVTGEPVNSGRRWFKWKKLYFNDKNRDFTHLSGFVLDGTDYDHVLKFDPDITLIDSTMQVKTIYFNFRNGILKYENQDSEVFEFQEKL